MKEKNIYKIIDNHKDCIIRELSTGRDISAILGGIGFNFYDDYVVAYEYVSKLVLI